MSESSAAMARLHQSSACKPMESWPMMARRSAFPAADLLDRKESSSPWQPPASFAPSMPTGATLAQDACSPEASAQSADTICELRLAAARNAAHHSTELID